METMDACLEPERISVILPVYNVEAYLDRCLESLVNQTYTALEILLIDDGSQDGSGELCDTWAKRDGRIRVWHRENGGAAAARNSGLDLATGDYILFVDADDYVDVDHCRVLMETIRGNPALDCVICGLLCVDDEGAVGEPQVMEERQFLSGLDVIKERYLKRDHRLNNDIINDRADSNSKKTKREILEYLGEQSLTDNDGGKSDNYCALPHLDVRKALILREERARKSHETV
jgi:glycosyltransferase involved in cell wall biosynthesis